MLILRDILAPLQDAFSSSGKGQERGTWFVYTLLAVIIHFTCSRTSNLLRGLQTLFALGLSQRRFYTFMASPKLPWQTIWSTLYSLISKPTVDGRLLLALDDFINPKTGKKIFGCASFFDHAAKINQARYPWSQNIVSFGLLKVIKGRWACLPLAFRFYHMKKTIDAGGVTRQGKPFPFQTKFEQAVHMLSQITDSFRDTPLLIVTDSWFGNDGLFKPMRQCLGKQAHLLSRLRVNASLYDFPTQRQTGQRGRSRKYGGKLGCARKLAPEVRFLAKDYSVDLYGKRRKICAYDQLVMLKTLKCPVRVVWVYRK